MSWGSSRSRQQKEGLEGCGVFFAVVVVCLFFFFFFFNVVFKENDVYSSQYSAM